MEYDRFRTILRNFSIEIKIALGLFLVLVVLAVVLSILFTRVDEGPQNVDITNFSSVSSVPEGYKKKVQDLISILIGKNETIPDDVLYGAVIRDGSYYEDVTGHTTIAHFLVDIEELRYSFEVAVSWPKGMAPDYDDMEVMIRCPYYTDVIYPETQCIAETPESQIERYLPNNYVLSNGHKVHIDKNYFGGFFRLLVNIDACRDQTLLDEALDYANKWIKSIYLDPYNYNIESYDTCLTSYQEMTIKEEGRIVANETWVGEKYAWM